MIRGNLYRVLNYVPDYVLPELSGSVVSNSLRPHCYSPPGSSVHWDSPGKNTRVGCHALLQGISQTQGWNPGLLHCGGILYHLSHQGSPDCVLGTLNR